MGTLLSTSKIDVLELSFLSGFREASSFRIPSRALYETIDIHKDVFFSHIHMSKNSNVRISPLRYGSRRTKVHRALCVVSCFLYNLRNFDYTSRLQYNLLVMNQGFWGLFVDYSLSSCISFILESIFTIRSFVSCLLRLLRM